MSTEAQINANRKNAQKSTGPVTDEGKAAVSQNAIKHGLFAVQDVVPTENQEQFDSMGEQMLADLAPEGAMETMLAQRAISLAWRLQRIQTMQAQVARDMVETHISYEQLNLGRRQPQNPRYAPEYLVLGRIAKEDWRGSKLIERLFEYERRIEKSLYKTMGELRAMKLMHQIAKTSSAEAQPPTLAEEQTNSEKQSQIPAVAGNPKHETRNPKGAEQNSEKQSQFEKWPETYGIDPKELKAFVKKTYGRTHPEMVKAVLKHLNDLPGKAQSTPRPQTQEGNKKTGLPLSLLTI